MIGIIRLAKVLFALCFEARLGYVNDPKQAILTFYFQGLLHLESRGKLWLVLLG